MKTLLSGVLLAGLTTGLRGDDPPAKGMDNPGAEHAALAKLAGEYSTTTIFKFGDGPGQESKGTAKISSMLGGRFISEEGQGEMMGQKYTSHKMYGFNNAAKRYEGVWTYTGSTGMMNLAGTSTDGGKSIVLAATVDQGAGNKMNMNITIKRIDDNRFTVEMAAKSPDGSPGPSLKTTYLRKK